MNRKTFVLVGTLSLFGASAWAIDVAKVNGKAITDRDLQMTLSGMNQGQRENVLKDSNARHQILNNVIDQELLVQEGEKAKLDQDADFKEAMNAFRKQYLANKALQKSIGSKLTDSEAEKYYDTNKRRYSTEQVHAWHILVPTEAEAKDVLAKVKAPGTDFQAMAERISKDPSAKNNRGDLGFFGRDRMVPEFTEPCFDAQAGDIIGPIHTAYGYHIVKVIEKKTGQPMEYHEVELRVKSELKQQLAQTYVLKLRNVAKIQVNEKELNKL